jgi:hypothetical protein
MIGDAALSPCTGLGLELVDEIDGGEEESWLRMFGQRPAEVKWIPAGLHCARALRFCRGVGRA